ncbi:MAG: hypothetical protein HY908_36270 [Myxococcales bacterium]|nr:hypothetical protein [Myxococcales bacterium]
MTQPPSRRINARLPPDVARKVAYLEKRTNKTATEIVLESIERYYAAVAEGGPGAAAEILAHTGFVGSAEGATELSRTYKAELARSLGHKT